MKRTTHSARTPRRNKGFSLVELMVGMTIALVMFLVIAHVFANFENQKRVTTLSSDTQSSGIMAMFEMEQAIRSAGAGIISSDTFDCVPANSFSYYTTAGPPPVTTTPVPGYGDPALIAPSYPPVVITNGASNGSDTLEVRVGAPVANSAPVVLMEDLTKTGPEQLKVSKGPGFPLHTVLLLIGPVDPEHPATNCAVVEVTGIPHAEQPNLLSIAPDPSGNTWNPTVAYRTANGWPDFGATVTTVYAPGSWDQVNSPAWPASPRAGGMYFQTYTVNSSGQLQVVKSVAQSGSSTEVLVADVVRFHAQYGVSSAPGVQDIQKWVEPVLGGSYETNWDKASLDSNKIKRIKAIRLVFVMRSPKLEATNVTGTCPNNAGVNKGPCAWEDTVADPAPLIDLSNDPNWQRYRYRVFQTIVPLRNTIALGV